MHGNSSHGGNDGRTAAGQLAERIPRKSNIEGAEQTEDHTEETEEVASEKLQKKQEK